MTKVGIQVGVAALLLCSPGSIAQPQSASSGIELRAMVFDEPLLDGKARLWFVVKNTSSAPGEFCPSLWGYTLVAVDPGNPAAYGTGEASLHGCGRGVVDRSWLILPGESRFDFYEVEWPSDNEEYTLQINLTLDRPVDSRGSRVQEQLTWNGRLSDAVAYGERLKGMMSEAPSESPP